MDLQRAQMMALDCMRYHRLFEGFLPWKFQFDNAKRRMGVCRLRARVIGLSKHFTLLNSEDQILDTILHEIAHALAPAHCGHDWTWKMLAKSIGAKPERCGGSEVVQPHTDWKGHCQDCDKVLGRTRRPSAGMMRTGYHTTCKRKANGGRLVWKFKGSVVLAEIRSSTQVPARPIDYVQESA